MSSPQEKQQESKPQTPDSVGSRRSSRRRAGGVSEEDVSSPAASKKKSLSVLTPSRRSSRLSSAQVNVEEDEDSTPLQPLPDFDNEEEMETVPERDRPALLDSTASDMASPTTQQSLRLELEEGGTPLKYPVGNKGDGDRSGDGDGRDQKSPAAQSTSTADSSRGGKSPGVVGGVSTPSRYRPDIGTSTKHHRSVNVPHSEGFEAQEPEPSGTGVDPTTTGAALRPSGPRIYIWGTRICVKDVQDSFRKFLLGYKSFAPDEDELLVREEDREHEVSPDEAYYLQRFKEIAFTEEPHLNFNLQHVKSFDGSLYRRILCYPADIIPYLDIVANEVFFANHPTADLPYQIEIRPFNAEKTRNMRGLNPEDIDQLITVTGMVIRTSPLIPEMRQGFFECTVCKNTMEVEVDRGRIEEPTVCLHCNTNHCFQLIHNRSQFMDKQIVKLQESPDDMPAGQTPHTVSLYVHGNLVDTVQPGDRVTVTGIYRAQPLRVNPKMRTVRAVYKTHIDVLHFRKADFTRLHQENDGSALSKERKEKILTWSERPDVYERLAHALSPSIYEHDDIKKGILCLLFGGTNKDLSGAGRGKFRSEINVLLCGDPGTSKSQMLQYVHNLVPRGQYTSGKGSSAVGLTAYVTRDPETKHFVLQTGALVLSDNGVCCIDEFDKMNDGTRSVLHEVMEQQTLSIAKAGIICQLNARTSILAAANPVDSQWNRDKTIVENVQLPHTLLSRFDLIFLLVDPQDEFYDRRLATHLVSLYYRSEEEREAEFMDMSLIRDYIAYAKANIHPKLTEEASQELIDKYLTMRKVGSGRGQVSAYPRQLESLIRLAEAHAKIRLSQVVQVKDVEEAYRLHREALKQSAVDPLTGRVDVNILAAGMSSTTRKHIAELSAVIKRRMAEKSFGISFNYKKLLQDIRETSDRMISRELFDEAVNDLCKNDIVSRTGDKLRLLTPIQAGAD